MKSRPGRGCALLIAIIGVLATALPALAAPGADADFACDGASFLVPPGTTGGWASDLAIQSDGAVILTGGTSSGDNNDAVLVRLLASGQIDTSFGDHGFTLTAVRSYRSWAESLAIQPDDKILIAGPAIDDSDNSSVFVARYLPDGSLDPSFGQNGIIEIPAEWETSEQIAIALNGDVVLLTNEENGAHVHVVLRRFKPDGSQDLGFGTSGIVTFVSPSTYGAVGQDLRIDPAGNILVAGEVTDSLGNYVAMLARFLPSGTPDSSFGVGGLVTPALGSSVQSIARSLTLQEDGDVLVAGEAGDSNTYPTSFALARFLPDGAPDPSFAGGQTVLGPRGYIAGMGIAADGSIAVAGPSSLGQSLNDNRQVAARYRSDGSLDTSFGSGGTVATYFGLTYSMAAAVGVRPDGELLLALETYDGGQTSGLGVEAFAPNGRNAGYGCPDVSVKQPGSGFLGKGVFDPSGEKQTIKVEAERGHTVWFPTRFHNAGAATESFLVSGHRHVKSGFELGARLPGGSSADNYLGGVYITLAPGETKRVDFFIRVLRTAKRGVTQKMWISQQSRAALTTDIAHINVVAR
jgi:uncharacterized delta-60 repeat protein